MSYNLLRTSGKVVSFNLKPNNLVPTKYDGVTCSGVVPFVIAAMIQDVRALYVQVAPTMENVPLEFENAEYLIFTYPNGERGVIPLVFIDENSITTTDKITVLIEVANISSTLIPQINQSFNLLGIEDYKITMK